MNEDTYKIRSDAKQKMIDKHNTIIEWHEKEIKKIKKQMHELAKMYYMNFEEDRKNL